MKKIYESGSGRCPIPKKLLLVMKLTAFLIVVLTMQVTATVYSQNKKLSLNMQGSSIKEVLQKIEAQSEYRFIYENEKVNLDSKVSIRVKDEVVENILKQLFEKNGINYSITENNLILINPSDKQLKNVGQESINFSQQKSISGRVTDTSKGSLPGVSVVVKGTTTGTITDADGKYTLAKVPENATLQFSFVGMKTQEIAVGSKTSINVTLLDESIGIDEVVAVGYGVQKKVNLTGAVGQVNSEVLESKPVTNVQELLQGKTPGLNITKSSGAPGSAASINIRGTSTIGGSSGVLVLIDGVPGNMYTLDPNDIESISVLKDAASASIYGSRAANGVILVTTKKGQNQKELQVSVNTSQAITNPLHFIDFVGAEDFMKLYNLARQNEGNQPLYTDDDFTKLKQGQIPDNVWYKSIFKKNQLLSNNHISLSGKTTKLQYNISGSYNYQSGAIVHNNYNRYIFKPDFTFNATNWLKFNSNIQYTETKINDPGAEGLISTATRISPITPIKNLAGQYWGPGGTPGGNPIAAANEGGLTRDHYKEVLSIFSATITPLKNWNIIPLASISTTDRWTEAYSKAYNLYNSDGTIYSEGQLSQQTISEASASNKTSLLQITSNYSKSFVEKHNFSLLAGYSQEYNYYEGFSASRKGMTFYDIYVLDIGQSAKDNSGTKYHDAIASYFGRLNYDFAGKYLFEANIRADGSSRFSSGHRWGTFPSFSLGWNVHKENFFATLTPTISLLKLRGSWGILGDALKISRYETRNIVSFDARDYAYNGSLGPGAWSESSFDPSITWEKAKMTNLGFDLGLLDNKLAVTFDYFNNIRSNILYKAPVPVEYGLSAPYINALEMRNRGIETLISYKNRYREFKYGIDVNFNYSKNKVLDLHETGPWRTGSSFTDVGTQLEMLYGYEALGLFQSAEDIEKSATQTNVFPGDIKYKDQNNDGKIDGNDRVTLNNKVPWRFGANINLEYKNFDFSASVYGMLNNYRYLQGYEGWAFYLTTNARPMHKDSWTVDNKGASYPRLTTNMTGNDREVSSFWLRKADYLKIQNIQLGYTLPKAMLQKYKVDNCRIFLSCQNLGIISNYDGFDPEGGYYPLARTYAFGLQLKF